jgi:hypothetical protein
MFEPSSSGGDFSTYVGTATGTFYRLDLGKIHYQKLSKASLLAPAEKKEGSLRCATEEIRCKICGMVFSAQGPIGIDGDEVIEAYEL